MVEFTARMPSEDEDIDAVLEPARSRNLRTTGQASVAAIPTISDSISIVSPTTITSADNLPEPDVPVSSNTESVSAVTSAIAEDPADQNIPVAPHDTADSEPESGTKLESRPITLPCAKALDLPVQDWGLSNSQAFEQSKPPRASKRLHGYTNAFRLNARLVVELVSVILFIGLAIWTWQLYNQRNALLSQVSSLESNPQLTIQKQTDKLIRHVGQLVALPIGETPTIADVSDVYLARQQSAFFANAQKNDRVLMYAKAGEAILYRPSTNKIILVAPLTFNTVGGAPATKQ
jgi:hypothetical protein